MVYERGAFFEKKGLDLGAEPPRIKLFCASMGLKGLCQLVILRTGVISWRYICQNSIVSCRNTIRNRTREHVQALRDMIITITCR